MAMSDVSSDAQTDPQRWFETIVNHYADGIVVIDNDYQLRFVNSVLEDLTGLSNKEIVGKKCYDILCPKDSEGNNLCLKKCPIDVGISYSIVRSSENNPIAVVGIRDVTELAEVDELRTSLLAGISHQLQTPISIIKAYASTLARPDVEWSKQTVSDKLKDIEEESDRLSTIISKFLYTSRLEYGEIKLNKLTIDLRKETQRIIKRCSGLTDKHRFETDFPPDFPPIFADPGRIEEVFINLIENAIKFSPNGGTIRIIGNHSDDHVLISVMDEGIGIHPDDGEKLFTRFYRAEDVLTTSTQGTGLGLYICRTLIEAHGGQISVEGKPGTGTCFTFKLPKHSGK